LPGSVAASTRSESINPELRYFKPFELFDHTAWIHPCSLGPPAAQIHESLVSNRLVFSTGAATFDPVLLGPAARKTG
jgi:hypothetical protein